MDQNVDIDDARILRYQAGSDIPTNKPTTELKVSFKELGLGGYGKVLHHNAKDGVITITIRKWSEYLIVYNSLAKNIQFLKIHQHLSVIAL